MMLIGVDYHPSFQTIAFFVEETGECGEQELDHSDGQAEKFYRDLKQRGLCVRVGMEATGYSRWFERLLAELGFELWIGDPAEIKAKRVKKQKFDREDARLLFRLFCQAIQGIPDRRSSTHVYATRQPPREAFSFEPCTRSTRSSQLKTSGFASSLDAGSNRAHSSTTWHSRSRRQNSQVAVLIPPNGAPIASGRSYRARHDSQ
jgi:hypothetical protein